MPSFLLEWLEVYSKGIFFANVGEIGPKAAIKSRIKANPTGAPRQLV